MKHAAKKITVAHYLSYLIDKSEKTQKEIAEEIGYENPNIITMFKQGLTKLPLNKIGPIARSLAADPVHLLRLVMTEYCPDTLIAIEDVLESTLLTKAERELIDAYRKAIAGSDATAVVCDARDVIALVMV